LMQNPATRRVWWQSVRRCAGGRCNGLRAPGPASRSAALRAFARRGADHGPTEHDGPEKKMSASGPGWHRAACSTLPPVRQA
jgi:hypothetical protein